MGERFGWRPGLIAQSERGIPLGTPKHRPNGDLRRDDARAEADVTALKNLVLSRLDDDQAAEVVVIDLNGKSEVADAMVVASGRSARHVAAMADKIQRDLKEHGFGACGVEGLPAADWVLLDAGDIIVHLFRPEVRGFYNLERIWAPELFAKDAAAPEAGAYSPSTDAMSLTDGEED